MNATISTSHGPRRAGPPPPLIQVDLAPSELLAAIRHLEREADTRRADRQDAAADHFNSRAIALRTALVRPRWQR